MGEKLSNIAGHIAVNQGKYATGAGALLGLGAARLGTSFGKEAKERRRLKALNKVGNITAEEKEKLNKLKRKRMAIQALGAGAGAGAGYLLKDKLGDKALGVAITGSFNSGFDDFEKPKKTDNKTIQSSQNPVVAEAKKQEARKRYLNSKIKANRSNISNRAQNKSAEDLAKSQQSLQETKARTLGNIVDRHKLLNDTIKASGDAIAANSARISENSNKQARKEVAKDYIDFEEIGEQKGKKKTKKEKNSDKKNKKSGKTSKDNNQMLDEMLKTLNNM